MCILTKGRCNLADDKKQVWFDEDSKTIIATTSCAADFFGVTSATLSNWTKNGCARIKHGMYDLKEVMDYRERLKYGVDEQYQKETSKMTNQELKAYHERRLKEEQATSFELKNKIMTGEYLDRSEVVSDLRNYFVTLKSSLLSLSDVLMNEIEPYINTELTTKLQTKLEDTICAALQELSVEGVYSGRE